MRALVGIVKKGTTDDTDRYNFIVSYKCFRAYGTLQFWCRPADILETAKKVIYGEYDEEAQFAITKIWRI